MLEQTSHFNSVRCKLSYKENILLQKQLAKSSEILTKSVDHCKCQDV